MIRSNVSTVVSRNGSSSPMPAQLRFVVDAAQTQALDLAAHRAGDRFSK